MDSFPASVVVAQPVAGAVLLTDDQIVAGPTPVDGTSDPIEQHVTLDGVTGVTAGSILLGAEAIGVGGKVVAATPSGGKLEVVYDPLPPQELFDRLDLEQDYDLSAAVPVPAGALAPSAKVHRDADGAFVLDLGATAGPAPLATTCEGEASFITISGLQSTLENDLRFYLHERTDAGDPKAAGAYVHGKLVQKVSGSLKVDAGFNGTYTCKKTLWEVPIPVSGVASILARPELPIGVAVSGSGSLTLAGATLGVEGSAGLNVKAGFTWDDSGDVTLLHAVDPIVEPPSITADLVTPPDFRVGLGAFTGLSSGVDLKVAGIGDVNIVQAQLGPKQSLDLAGLSAQASDTHYASSYDLTGVASVAIGTDLSKLISWLKLPVTLQALQVQETLPISHSPTGSVAVSTTSAAPGDTVHVHVALDPDHVTYLGHYNVRRVLVYAFEDGQDPALVGTIELSASNQTSFDTDWDTSGLPAGDYHVVAFVVDDLLARIHELPLEVSADPKQTVHLANVCAASAGRVRAQNACSGSASWSEVQDPTANGVGIDVHTSSYRVHLRAGPERPERLPHHGGDGVVDRPRRLLQRRDAHLQHHQLGRRRDRIDHRPERGNLRQRSAHLLPERRQRHRAGLLHRWRQHRHRRRRARRLPRHDLRRERAAVLPRLRGRRARDAQGAERRQRRHPVRRQRDLHERPDRRRVDLDLELRLHRPAVAVAGLRHGRVRAAGTGPAALARVAGRHGAAPDHVASGAFMVRSRPPPYPSSTSAPGAGGRRVAGEGAPGSRARIDVDKRAPRVAGCAGGPRSSRRCARGRWRWRAARRRRRRGPRRPTPPPWIRWRSPA